MGISSIKLIVMKTKLLLAACSLLVILFSCDNKNREKDAVTTDAQLSELKKNAPPSDTENAFQSNTEQEPIPVGNTQQPANADSSPLKQPVKSVAHTDWDKKIIKTAHLKIEVKDFKSYNEKMHQTIKQFGGYIAEEEQHLSDEKSETVITIKVPVAQFEDMMNQLPGGDVKVMERKITSEDVSGQVVDTRSRLEAKKQMRLKYLDFLKQSKNMEEVLQVQNEINGIQEEIESASGRVNYLSQQSAFSTIHLTFYQPMAGYKPEPESPSFSTRIGSAFKAGGSWIGELFIGLISIWPLLLVITGAFIGWKKLRMSQKTPAASSVK